MSELAATLTIRLSTEELRSLRKRARAARTTPSAIVRRLLEQDLGLPDDEGPTLGELSRRWVGSVSSAHLPHGQDVPGALTGWNPDRRG